MIKSDKFFGFVRRELEAQQNLLIQRRNNATVLFRRWVVVPSTGRWQVRWDDTVLEFGTQRAAVSWCVAEHHKQYNLARQIIELDQRSQMLAHSIQQRQASLERDPDNFVLESKVAHRRAEKYSVDQQLEKLIGLTKYMQFKGFYHDTQRHSRNRA